jgi:hypothetical protein
MKFKRPLCLSLLTGALLASGPTISYALGEDENDRVEIMMTAHMWALEVLASTILTVTCPDGTLQVSIKLPSSP